MQREEMVTGDLSYQSVTWAHIGESWSTVRRAVVRQLTNHHGTVVIEGQ